MNSPVQQVYRDFLSCASALILAGCSSPTIELPEIPDSLRNNPSARPLPVQNVRNDIPMGPKTAAAELARQKKEVAQLPKEGTGYIINSDGEILISKVGSIQAKTIKMTLGGNKLNVIEGKLFINDLRIYDAQTLLNLAQSNSFISSGLDDIVAKFGIQPNAEDQALLDGLQTNNQKSLALSLGSEPIPDYSHKHSFRAVRLAQQDKGSFSFNGDLVELKSPFFIQLDQNSYSSNSLGSASFKRNNYYVATVWAGAEKSESAPFNHFETSFVYGLSFKPAYIEIQKGWFSSLNNDQKIAGDRDMITLGADSKYFSAFLRSLHRSSESFSNSVFGPGVETNFELAGSADSKMSVHANISYLAGANAAELWYAEYGLNFTHTKSIKAYLKGIFDSNKNAGLVFDFNVER